MSRSWLERALRGTGTLRLGEDEVWILPKRDHVRDPKLSEIVLPEAHQDGPAWQAQVEAVQRLLQRQKSSALPKKLEIVVSNAFVRYVLVPWTDEQLSLVERQELVRALFQDRYGDRDGNWNIAIEPPCFGAPALAAAMDARLVAALQDICGKAGFRCVSLLPALVENLHLRRRPLKKSVKGWFVDASDNRLVTLAFCDGRWSNVGNERCEASNGIAATLLPLLRRDAILTPGLLNATVFIANTRAALDDVSSTWPVVRFDGLDAAPCA